MGARAIACASVDADADAGEDGKSSTNGTFSGNASNATIEGKRSGSKSGGAGAVVGAVIGATFGVAVLSFGVFFAWRRYRGGGTGAQGAQTKLTNTYNPAYKPNLSLMGRETSSA